MARKTPQEKKRLSLAKDRRSAYSANSKASRKNVPRRKKERHRVERHGPAAVLRVARGKPDSEVLEDLDVKALRRTRRKMWRKDADIPLGEFLELKGKGLTLIATKYEDRPKRSRRTRT